MSKPQTQTLSLPPLPSTSPHGTIIPRVGIVSVSGTGEIFKYVPLGDFLFFSMGFRTYAGCRYRITIPWQYPEVVEFEFDGALNFQLPYTGARYLARGKVIRVEAYPTTASTCSLMVVFSNVEVI